LISLLLFEFFTVKHFVGHFLVCERCCINTH